MGFLLNNTAPFNHAISLPGVPGCVRPWRRAGREPLGTDPLVLKCYRQWCGCLLELPLLSPIWHEPYNLICQTWVKRDLKINYKPVKVTVSS